MKSRAIGIISGGLDSLLAVELLRRQDIEVLAVTFVTPFFGSEKGQEAARALGVDHRVIDITREHLRIVRRPQFGYGRHMNPCMDCHALMFNVAGELLDGEGYDFLFSGEVLGQRPLSQNRQALERVAEASGRPDEIVRPLSALCLPPSGPEKRGLLDRNRLLGLQGRSRKPQMALAAQWGIVRYPSPAGGCLLTDANFSRRLAQLLKGKAPWEIRDLHLLPVGRHLLPLPERKIVVGRNQKENETLQSLVLPDDLVLAVESHPGPLVLIPHGGASPASPQLLQRAAGVCVRYSDAPQETEQLIRVQHGARQWWLHAAAATPRQTDAWLI
jgi:tRNA-specific 2-thiouridylase